MPFPAAPAAQDIWTPGDWQSEWRNRPRHVVQDPDSPRVAVFYWVSLRISFTFPFPARVEQLMYNGVPLEEPSSSLLMEG